jgi:hypothetical protein
MKDLRPARVAATVVLATLGFAALPVLSGAGADEPTEQVYGTVDAIGPLVG